MNTDLTESAPGDGDRAGITVDTPAATASLQAALGSRYHRLSAGVRWWRTLVVLVAIVLLWSAAKVLIPDAWRESDLPLFGPASDVTVALAYQVLLLPLILSGVWLVERRRPGTVSSVIGRLRWSWLALCLLPALDSPRSAAPGMSIE